MVAPSAPRKTANCHVRSWFIVSFCQRRLEIVSVHLCQQAAYADPVFKPVKDLDAVVEESGGSPHQCIAAQEPCVIEIERIRTCGACDEIDEWHASLVHHADELVG